MDDTTLVLREAATGGCEVEGHVQAAAGAQRAIDAGIHVLARGNALTPGHHRQMAEEGIFLAGADTPFTAYRGTEAAVTGPRAQAARYRQEEGVNALIAATIRPVAVPSPRCEKNQSRWVAVQARAHATCPAGTPTATS